jgi:tellurite resistance protein
MTEIARLHPLFSDTQLCADDVIAIAAALRHIAELDGSHPAELEMIASFTAELEEELGEAVVLPASSPEKLAAQLTDPTTRTIAVQTCIMLALADGKISDTERGLIRQYAGALGLSEAQYLALESELVAWSNEGDLSVLYS